MPINEQYDFDECPMKLFEQSFRDIIECLEKYGSEDEFYDGNGDYGIQRDNNGNWQHSIGILNFSLLSTPLISDIYNLLHNKWTRFSVMVTLIAAEEWGEEFDAGRLEINRHGIRRYFAWNDIGVDENKSGFSMVPELSD